jgi:hypothetical protein
VPSSAGYAYEQDYFDAYGVWHSGIDFDTPTEFDYSDDKESKKIFAATDGVVTQVIKNYLNAGVGDLVIVQEASLREDNTVEKRQNRFWMYLHLADVQVVKESPIRAQKTPIAAIHAGQGHLHLSVSSDPNPSNVNWDSNINVILGRTMSPLQAYWEYKNGIAR